MSTDTNSPVYIHRDYSSVIVFLLDDSYHHCNVNGHQPHSVVMTNWERVALPPPRQWCLLTTLHRQNVSVLQRTLAYIPQENYSGHDRNDPQGERSNRELTDTIIGTDKMGVIDEEKGQTESWPIQLLAQTRWDWSMRRKVRRRVDSLTDTIIGTPSHSA